jgi:hypothetical protein
LSISENAVGCCRTWRLAIVHHSPERAPSGRPDARAEDAGFGDLRTGELGIMSLGFVTLEQPG